MLVEKKLTAPLSPPLLLWRQGRPVLLPKQPSLVWQKKGGTWRLQIKAQKSLELRSLQPPPTKIKVVLGNNSQLSLFLVRDNGQRQKEEWHFDLGEKSFLQQVIYLNNRGVYHFSNQVNLAGRGSQAQLVFANQNQENGSLVINFFNQLSAPQTKSQLWLKALGEDEAQALINALGKIRQRAFGSQAQVKEDILQLSPKSLVSVKPNLEILNKEVVAKHSATLGNLDKNALLYLTARGLALPQAKKLLVGGFFRPLLREIVSPAIKAEFCQLIT